MSFLRSEGHHNAMFYPLCTLLTEARLARKRLNMQFITQALLIQAAIASVLSKEGQKAFNELVKGLSNGD